ncbi:hypothetical protein [Micrococcus sp.]|uniref:hypothetical protein n=1 Tax=Micrococcus sp. TaxID=1271 RepID=UPI002A908806|nr:hypothetical protein [Micrococcus sp.]MDY6054336.1 hypothetical protein [Micrococcus sp.]
MSAAEAAMVARDGAVSAASSAADSAVEAGSAADRAVGAADRLNADARTFGDAVRSGEFKGEKGDVGPAPDVSWAGDRLTVGGQTGPALTGPQGDRGPQGLQGIQGPQGDRGPQGLKGDTGAPGPANTLTIGTVTSGTTAGATLTGEAPAQTLSLVLPQGPQGDRGPQGPPGVVSSASAYLLVGPGRPDQPSTTAGVITGGEPVGAEYRSTDGAGVGADVWIKTSRGWVVSLGDTGWRGMIAATTGMFLNVRRTPDGVRVHGGFLFSGGGTKPAINTKTVLLDGIYTGGLLPNGFRPDTPTQASTRSIASLSAVVRSRSDTDPASSLGVLYVDTDNGDARANGRVVMKTIGGGFGGAIVEYPTAEPWPTTLPGTPA